MAFDRPIASLRRGIGRLIDGCAEGLIGPDEFRPRVAGPKGRLARAEEQARVLLEAAEAERGLALVVSRVEDLAARVRHGLDGLDWPGTHEVIRDLVRLIGTIVGTIITRLVGAVLLEANDEWQLQRPYMQVESMAEMTAPPAEIEPARIPPEAA